MLARSYHRVLRLNGLDLQAVLYSSRCAVGLCFALQASPALLGIRLVLSIPFGRLGSWGHVSPLLFGDVGLGAVDGLHMLPERAGVCVALGTARDLAHIRFLPKRDFRRLFSCFFLCFFFFVCI